MSDRSPRRLVKAAVGYVRTHVVAFTALFVALGGGAIAAIPDSGGVIHGCYKRNGAVRIIDPSAGDACSKPEASLDWNQRGPKGDPGPPGPPGVGGVVARARSSGPITAGNCEPNGGLPEVPGVTATWTQAGDESDQIFGQITWRHDNSRPGSTPPDAGIVLQARVDGVPFGNVMTFDSREPGAVRTETFAVPAAGRSPGPGWLFETGRPSRHVVTVGLCNGGSGVSETVQRVSLDVLGVR